MLSQDGAAIDFSADASPHQPASALASVLSHLTYALRRAVPFSARPARRPRTVSGAQSLWLTGISVTTQCGQARPVSRRTLDRPIEQGRHSAAIALRTLQRLSRIPSRLARPWLKLRHGTAYILGCCSPGAGRFGMVCWQYPQSLRSCLCGCWRRRLRLIRRFAIRGMANGAPRAHPQGRLGAYHTYVPSAGDSR